jgi:pyruvate-formate lyase-activating enzyme
VKLDSNGTDPKMLEKILDEKLVDYMAMDIKGPYWNQKYYKQLSQVIGLPEKVLPSLTQKLLQSIKLVD